MKSAATLSPSLPHTSHTGEQVIIFTISAAHTHVTQLIQPIIDYKIISHNIINKDQCQNINNIKTFINIQQKS